MGAIEASTIRATGAAATSLSAVHAGHALSTAGGNSVYGFNERSTPDAGGNAVHIMHYAVRDLLNGFVRFTDDTTNLAGGISERPVAQTQAIQRSFVVPGAYHINTGKATMAEIKTAVTNYGAVTTSMFGNNINYSGGYWHQGNSAYFQPASTTEEPDHLVLIVGWDDAYPRTNFNSANQPVGNGAWLVKNSWGEGWGENGYFWMSYEDKHAGDDSWVFAPARPITPDDQASTIYDYNRDHASFTYGPGSLYGTNVFNAGPSSNERLTQVRVYVNSAPQDNIRIFLTNNYSASAQVAGTISANSPIATFNANYVGYYSIDIPSQPVIAANSSFAVTVSYANGVPLTQARIGTPSGRSYVGVSGATTETTGNANLIKAVTSPASGNLAATIISQPTSQSVTVGNNAVFSVSASGLPAPSFQWQISTDGGVNWENISGATSGALTVPNVTIDDHNGNMYRVIVSNTIDGVENNVTSNAVTLTVTEGGGFGTNPPTGIPDLSDSTAAMYVFFGLSAGLWSYIFIRIHRNRKGYSS